MQSIKWIREREKRMGMNEWVLERGASDEALLHCYKLTINVQTKPLQCPEDGMASQPAARSAIQ